MAKKNKKLINQTSMFEKTGVSDLFASDVIHEFNNMLNAIIGYTEILMLTPENDPNKKKYLQEIYNVGKNASRLLAHIDSINTQGNSH